MEKENGQMQGTGLTKSLERGKTDINQTIQQVQGKVKRDETGKLSCNQFVKDLTCKEICLGT